MNISEFERRKKSDIEVVKDCIVQSPIYQEYLYYKGFNTQTAASQLAWLVKDILIQLDENKVTNK